MKNKKRNYSYSRKNRKRYSFTERMSYFENMSNKGKSIQKQDYAYGYLDGMRGIKSKQNCPAAEAKGNEAGLRFWAKLMKIKV